MNLLLEIVLTFMKIGALSFGGGYAAMPLVQKQVVEIKGWMSVSEFLDIVAIDELTPGPVAINAATFVGIRMAGIPGAIAATFGCILPSVLIALILVRLYYSFRNLLVVEGALDGLKAMVVGLIACTALSILVNALFTEGIVSLEHIDWLATAIFLLSLAAFRYFKEKVNPIVILMGGGVISLICCSLFQL